MKNWLVIILGLLWASSIYAAADTHTDHKNHTPADTEQNKALPRLHMNMIGPLGLSMAREGSGTAWQPDTSPMPMIMVDISGWMLMFHGSIFAGINYQGSDRGDAQLLSVNWLMASARHKLGLGQFSARAMLSLEPLTVAGGGYPLLYQTGETWQGQPIHDHQHPHDLFMELALKYAVPVSDDVGLEFYVAAAGEPALGPVAFPHRMSTRSNPLAPLGHHWYDSTHITFGVLTLGIFNRQWKIEGSWFNGREPDENRYNRPLPKLIFGQSRSCINLKSN